MKVYTQVLTIHIREIGNGHVHCDCSTNQICRNSCLFFSCKIHVTVLQQQHNKFSCRRINHGPYPPLYATRVPFLKFSSAHCKTQSQQVMWVEQIRNVPPQKLDHKFFKNSPFVKTGPSKISCYHNSENFWLKFRTH